LLELDKNLTIEENLNIVDNLMYKMKYNKWSRTNLLHLLINYKR
jgi:hypothetical protein